MYHPRAAIGCICSFSAQKTSAMKAALYIRLSKEDDHDGPSESVINQKALLTRFASEQSLEVHDIYVDDGWSGGNFDRPAFRRLLSDIECGKVNMVITKDLSRLGRDYILTGHYLERYFPEHRVRYVSLLDGIDTGTDSCANDITPFRAIMNDMYAKDISKKITSVKRDKQRKGEFIGGKAVYGYQKHPADKNRLFIDEEAGTTVRRIFSMALSGMSCREIASFLNRESIPSPAVYAGLTVSGKGLWSSERISEMLQNETYIGNMVQGKRIKSSYKSKKSHRQKREDWIVVENTHEPLVDRADFEAVQKLLANRRHIRSRTYDFPLKGLVFCHECGHPLGVINRKSTSGDGVLYFICRTYQRFTESHVCSAHCIKVKTVEALVSESVINHCTPHISEDTFLIAAEQAVRHSRTVHAENIEIEKLQKRVEKLTAQMEKAYQDHLNGMIAPEDFKRFYNKIRSERDKLQNRLSDTPLSAINDAEPNCAAALKDEFLSCLGTDRATLFSLIHRIELTAEKDIIIFFRFAQ